MGTSRSQLQSIFVEQLRSTPLISENNVSGFGASYNASTGGVDVSFSLTDVTGIRSITVVRASTPDVAQATVVQTWTASASKFIFADTDKSLQSIGTAYYWLKLEPVNVTGTEVTVGPQSITLNPSLIPPGDAAAISASHAAAANGIVLVTANVSGMPVSGSIKIYASGYQGVASFVAITEQGKAPLQFGMSATGETVTLKAVAVSDANVEASSGPTTTLALTAAATPAATPEGVSVIQLSTGNQIGFPANLEANVTGYQIWRGTRGTPFSSATLLTTISSSANAVVYLDTTGLSGDFQYFVIAVSGSGNSQPSDAAIPPVAWHSLADVPDDPAGVYRKPIGVSPTGQATTETYTANSVSGSVNETTTNYVNISGSGTIAEIAAFPAAGGYVRLTICGAIASTNASATGWSLTFYKNGVAITPNFQYQTFATAGDGKYIPFSFSVLDPAPGTGNVDYRVDVATNSSGPGTVSLIPVSLLAENFKA